MRRPPPLTATCCSKPCQSPELSGFLPTPSLVQRLPAEAPDLEAVLHGSSCRGERDSTKSNITTTTRISGPLQRCGGRLVRSAAAVSPRTAAACTCAPQVAGWQRTSVHDGGHVAACGVPFHLLQQPDEPTQVLLSILSSPQPGYQPPNVLQLAACIPVAAAAGMRRGRQHGKSATRTCAMKCSPADSSVISSQSQNSTTPLWPPCGNGDREHGRARHTSCGTASSSGWRAGHNAAACTLPSATPSTAQYPQQQAPLMRSSGQA